MEIFREIRFEAAHYLPNTPEGHKCRRMHGHSFRARIHIAGPVDPKVGWIMDFSDIMAVVEPLRLQLDHNCLNDIEGLENPTSENIAHWFWDRLKPELPALSCIELFETCTNGCIYRGEE